MTDAIIETVTGWMGSPWIYLALFAIAAIDAFFPAVPSESLVITAGVFAASQGEPNLLLIMVTAAAGAFLGDHISYAIGRYGGSRLYNRTKAESKARGMFDWARRTLDERGGVILVVARYIPGGRTAVTLSAGSVKYPLRKFSFFDAIAALSWGVYSGMIGYLGGHAFEDNPLLGLGVGLGIAIGVSVIVEVVRAQLKKRRERAASGNGLAAQTPSGGDDTAPENRRETV